MSRLRPLVPAPTERRRDRGSGGLVENPRRTIVALITDFCEGAPLQRLFAVTKGLIESGVTLLGLAALDERAEPMYDHGIATYALAECAIMTRDPRVTQAALKAAQFIVDAQTGEVLDSRERCRVLKQMAQALLATFPSTLPSPPLA